MRGNRKLSGVRLVGLVLTLLLATSSIPPVAAGLNNDSARPVSPAPAVKGQTPPSTEVAGADADWWSTVQENIRRSEYHVAWQEQTYLPDLAEAYQAPNRAQNLRTYFTPSGPIVIPRLWSEEAGTPRWRWEVSLAAWGRAGRLQPVLPAELEVQENLVEYRRGDPLTAQAVTERYTNDQEGLGQSFTLVSPPQGGQFDGPLQLDLALGGDLVPEVVQDGAGIEFRSQAGQAGLHLGSLAATDAAGRDLPAWFSVSGSALSLFVADASAVYPIALDAIITGLLPDPDWAVGVGQAGALFGRCVATAGDVNGDGYSDVIVGIPYYDGGLADEGRAEVFPGHPLGLSTSSMWRKESDQTEAHFGWSVATAGDVNGDGYADIIVGAPEYDNGLEDEGGAWIYHGSSSGPHTVADNFDEGNQADARFGASVATAGDVNGDGYADVIVGAPLYANDQSEEGRVWVWHGSSSGISESHNWRAESNKTNGALGVSVATAGDVNGDGYADIIVGADRYDNGQTEEGLAFVWHGSANGVNNGENGDPTNVAWKAEINDDYARLGRSVSTAGDVNGDGYADVIVGAPYYTNGQGGEGGAWVYLGSSSGLLDDWDNQDEGNEVTAHFGMSVATAGDVNGDGYADVIVGAPDYGSNDEGRAWVWHGSPSGISTSYDWRAEGELTNGRLGFSVGTAGDVNGDGFSDVIIGEPNVRDPAGVGLAYVYHGSPSSLSETAGWTKRSNQENALFGTSVGTAGDVNADGYADVIVGAPRWDGGQENEGAAWVYLGQATGLTSAPHWYRRSNNPGAEFGTSVGTAGDVNGDGYDDVIVGAPFWHNPETNEGAAFVYHGSSSGLSETAPPLWSKASNQVGAEFGTSVGTAGDVNGDGYADIIVGAPFWQSGGQERGAVWLYYGSPGGPHSPPDWYTVGDQADAQYGHAVGTAGDVNRDGYSDVIVGAPYWQDDVTREGRAWVYLGSRTGLRYDLHWYAEGNNFIAHLGHSVGTAGDVDGDGYSDVIVGAPDYGDDGLSQEGKVWVFHGSSGGLEASSSWSREGGQNGAHYGWSVGTAGDVNGDGYSDVIIGIELWNGGLTNEGGASVYHGSFGGLVDTLTWHGEGDQASAHYGTSAGTAGDVNGDGYADVIVGAPNYNQVYPDEGQAFLYYGNGGPGVSLRPRQQHPGGAPLAHLGMSDDWDSFRARLRAGTPFGRGRILLECEPKPLGARFTGSDTQLWGDSQNSVPGNDKYIVPHDLFAGTPYHWRVRWRYDPATTPWMPASRWLTVPRNGWNEMDLRTAGSRVMLPLVLRDYD